jgi:hypothetical protein
MTRQNKLTGNLRGKSSENLRYYELQAKEQFIACRKQTLGKTGRKTNLGHSVNFHLACLDSRSIIKLPTNRTYIFIKRDGEEIKVLFSGWGIQLGFI